MSENEKKNENQSCCCNCWKYLLIAILFLIAGIVVGRVLTMHHHWHHMKQSCGIKAYWHGHDRERECREREYMKEKEGCGEHKYCSTHKADMEKCKPGCTCPKCAKKTASLSEPNKAGSAMMDQKEQMPKPQ